MSANRHLLYAVVRPETTFAWEDDPDSVLRVARGHWPVALVCGDPPAGPAGVTELVAFADAVERLFATADLLPMRHGCVLNDAGVANLATARGEEFLTTLGRIEGCIEMGIRLLPPTSPAAAPPPTTVTPATGVAYLRARQREFAARDLVAETSAAIAAEMRATFGDLIRDVRVEPPRTPGGSYLAALLVPRTAEAGVRAAFARYGDSRPGKALLTGPWPPYSFAATAEEGA